MELGHLLHILPELYMIEEWHDSFVGMSYDGDSALHVSTVP